jgi:hypothetical protein
MALLELAASWRVPPLNWAVMAPLTVLEPDADPLANRVLKETPAGALADAEAAIEVPYWRRGPRHFALR